MFGCGFLLRGRLGLRLQLLLIYLGVLLGLGGDLVDQRSFYGPVRKLEGGHFCRDLLVREHAVRKAELDGPFRVHPCLTVHEVRDPCAGQPGPELVGVDDALLDLLQHFDGLFHLDLAAEG